jgi:hypothetical protein
LYEADRAEQQPMFNEQKSNIVFAEWLRKRREAANILIGENGVPSQAVPPPPR